MVCTIFFFKNLCCFGPCDTYCPQEYYSEGLEWYCNGIFSQIVSRACLGTRMWAFLGSNLHFHLRKSNAFALIKAAAAMQDDESKRAELWCTSNFYFCLCKCVDVVSISEYQVWKGSKTGYCSLLSMKMDTAEHLCKSNH